MIAHPAGTEPHDDRSSPAASGMLGARRATWLLAEEAPAVLMFNGETFGVMMITPADIEDFCTGFAISEGIVASAGDISAVRIEQGRDGVLVNVVVAQEAATRAAARMRTISGRSSCGICGAQTLEAALPPPPRVSGMVPARAAVLRAFAALPAHQPMNARNRSTHAAAFCTPDGTVLTAREDIGRHNALDKLIGALARAGIAGASGFLILSSRFSVEMALKAAMLGVPFAASVSAPSALALDVAVRAGMAVGALAGEDVMVFEANSMMRSG